MKKRIKDIGGWIIIGIFTIIIIFTCISPVIIFVCYDEPWYLFLYFITIPLSFFEAWIGLATIAIYYDSYYRFKR